MEESQRQTNFSCKLSLCQALSHVKTQTQAHRTLGIGGTKKLSGHGDEGTAENRKIGQKNGKNLRDS